jgi:prepilin-type N-terminal cleavage/methylation domain-containing protein
MKRTGKQIASGSSLSESGQRGLTLIETLIALTILAAIGGVFLVGMTTSSRALIVNKDNITAESLAKSQMEYVKSQPYDSTHNPPVYGVDPSLNTQGYNILPSAVRLYPQIVHTGNDEGLQKITVTITRGEKTVFTLEGYKCNIGQ